MQEAPASNTIVTAAQIHHPNQEVHLEEVYKITTQSYLKLNTLFKY